MDRYDVVLIIVLALIFGIEAALIVFALLYLFVVLIKLKVLR